MKPSAQLAAAIEVLQQVLIYHTPAQKALEAWGKEHRFAGSSDRNVIGNLVYDVLRSKASLAHIMGKDSPRALIMALYATQWGTLADLQTMLEVGDRHAPTPLTEQEIECIANAAESLKEAPAYVLGNFPKWMEQDLTNAYGDGVIDVMTAQTTRAPVDIRVNALKTNREDALEDLSHINATPCAISPLGIRIAPAAGKLKTPHLEAEQSYHRGWFEVQDEGSQLVSLLCGARPEQQVLDYCAGGGGKTLALAAQMKNTGQIFAYDSDRLRLAGLYPRLDRCGATNIHAVDPKKPDVLETLLGRMDLVVIDAPCTGSGTWRRKPDSKWRLSHKQLLQRVAEQREALTQGASYVKRGGVLAYITCSLLPQENREQLGLFLSQNTDFNPLKFQDHIEKSLYATLEKAIPNLKGETAITLLPSELGTDGFFIGLMKRH